LPGSWKPAAVARATVTRRLCAIAGFCRYAAGEELPGHSLAAHVRRPRLDYESHATALDRNELGALLVAAGLGPPAGHALISLLALNGLRVCEATGAGIWHLGLEQGHRTLVITRKGGKVITVPLAPRTARRPASTPKDRCFSLRPGGGCTGTAPPGSYAVWPTGLGSASTPALTLRHAFITAASTPGYHCVTCRRQLPTPTRAPPCATTGHAPASTSTPPNVVAAFIVGAAR
jgi:integrase/recombinase XerD